MKYAHTERIYKVGYYIGLFGTALILLWLGIFKFTNIEATSIKPLISHHFLLSWLYSIASEQMVSNLIGCIEISIALAFIIGVRFATVRKIAFIGNSITFCLTLSFIFTTPNMWRSIEGIPVTDFFILKDVALLGVGFMSLRKP